MARRSRVLLVTVLMNFALSTSMAWGQEASLPQPVGGADQGTDVVGAFKDSFTLLLIEHAWRIGLQEKTRSQLGGNFWADYRRSVRIPPQWSDTDAWWVNYIGHPVHGAAAGYILLRSVTKAPVDFSLERNYWSSRARAMVWSAFYSLQFEIGPLSEASIVNVGMKPETTGWVDYVVTPMGAYGLIVAEDLLDRFVTVWIEGRLRNPLLRIPVRLALNPGRTLSNTSSGRAPWHREGRRLTW